MAYQARTKSSARQNSSAERGQFVCARVRILPGGLLYYRNSSGISYNIKKSRYTWRNLCDLCQYNGFFFSALFFIYFLIFQRLASLYLNLISILA